MVTSVTKQADYPLYVLFIDRAFREVELRKALVGIHLTILSLTWSIVFIHNFISSLRDIKVYKFSSLVDLDICSFHLDLFDVEFWSSLLLLFLRNGWWSLTTVLRDRPVPLVVYELVDWTWPVDECCARACRIISTHSGNWSWSEVTRARRHWRWSNDRRSRHWYARRIFLFQLLHIGTLLRIGHCFQGPVSGSCEVWPHASILLGE